MQLPPANPFWWISPVLTETLHYNDANGAKTTSGTVNAQGGSTAYFTSVADNADFHTYGVEWTPEGVKFFMDGNLTLHTPTESINPNRPFNKENNPYYLMLDMQPGAVGPELPETSVTAWL